MTTAEHLVKLLDKDIARKDALLRRAVELLSSPEPDPFSVGLLVEEVKKEIGNDQEV